MDWLQAFSRMVCLALSLMTLSHMQVLLEAAVTEWWTVLCEPAPFSPKWRNPCLFLVSVSSSRIILPREERGMNNPVAGLYCHWKMAVLHQTLAHKSWATEKPFSVPTKASFFWSYQQLADFFRMIPWHDHGSKWSNVASVTPDSTISCMLNSVVSCMSKLTVKSHACITVHVYLELNPTLFNGAYSESTAGLV